MERREPARRGRWPSWRLEARRLVAAVAVAVLAGAGCAGSAPPDEPTGASGPVQTVAVAASDAPPTTTPPAPTTSLSTVPEPSPAPTTTVPQTSLAALHGPGVEAVAATALRQDGVLEAWAERPDGPEPGPATWQVPLRNEFGGDLHLLVLDQVGGWLRVQVPVRPNGTEGWVRADDVTLGPIAHRIEIAVGERRLRVLQGEQVVLDRVVVVGRGSTPTPTGRFYLRDSFPWNPASVYGPFVLPLSAFSESIESINGGEAVVAIHGTNRPDLLGQAVSLGCIRLHNDDVTALAQLVVPGTPVHVLP